MSPTKERAAELEKALEGVAAEYDQAVQALQQAEEKYSRTLLAAYREGLSWAAVAKATGLKDGNQARLRAERAMTDEEISPSRRPSAKDRASAPGVSVSEAATRLGVARSTVYDRIDRGELEATTDQLGRTRVIMPD